MSTANNTQKLIWQNQQYIKLADLSRFALLVGAFLHEVAIVTGGEAG